MIFVMEDFLSKFGHFIPHKYEISNAMGAEAFIKNVVEIHGIQKSIVSDWDGIF